MDDKADTSGDQARRATSEPTLAEDLRQLIDDGRALAEAELAWQKARASFAGRQAGGIAILGTLAAALALLALFALSIGLLLALSPLLSPWGATAAVAGGLLLAGLLSGAAAAMRLRRMARLIADRKPEP